MGKKAPATGKSGQCGNSNGVSQRKNLAMKGCKK